MREHSYLLFGEGRWALAQRWIVRVEGVDGEETPMPVSLSALGFEETQLGTLGHVLRLETPSCQLSLLVYGKLNSLQVKSDQVIELPLQFFSSSPASALILRDDQQMPALLLDPSRLHAHQSNARQRNALQLNDQQSATVENT